MEQTKACTICKNHYPDLLLAPFISMSSGQDMSLNDVCPLCALKEMRKVHYNKYMFHGELALDMHHRAKAYAKKKGYKI